MSRTTAVGYSSILINHPTMSMPRPVPFGETFGWRFGRGMIPRRTKGFMQPFFFDVDRRGDLQHPDKRETT